MLTILSGVEKLNSDLLVEVKCPFTARDSIISPETVPYIQYVDEHLCLDRHHDYFYQVQGQMLCTSAKSVDFVIYTFKDLCVIRIDRDDTFSEEMLQKLQAFFIHISGKHC